MLYRLAAAPVSREFESSSLSGHRERIRTQLEAATHKRLILLLGVLWGDFLSIPLSRTSDRGFPRTRNQ
jgi:hypothetical protein